MSEIIKTRQERIAAVLAKHGVEVTDDLTHDLLTHALSDTVCDWQAKTGQEMEQCAILRDVDLEDPNEDFHRGFDGNFYIPGEGFGVKMNSMTRGQDLGDLWNAKFRCVHGKGPNEGRYGGGMRGCFISERKLMSLMATYLNHHRTLVDDADEDARGHLDRAVDGFDTRDSSKDPRNPLDRGQQDYFDLNKSDSSIHIGVCSSTGQWLNGSMTDHQHFIRIDITGPTGRKLVEVGMSMDQFANALVGQSMTPCTCLHYWSVNEFNRMLVERVKPPESIQARLKKRLSYAAANNREGYQEVLDALRQAGEDGKMGKVRARELADRLERALGTLEGHTAFVLEQGTEEASAMLEQSAIFLKSFYGVDFQEMEKIAPLGFALREGIDGVKPVEVIGMAGDPSIKGGGDDGVILHDDDPTRAFVKQIIGTLDPDAQKVMGMRYGIGYPVSTLEEVSRAMGITREEVRQIEGKALKDLQG